MTFWDFTLFIRLLPTLFVAWVAWVISRSPAQHASNRILAAFLALIGSEIFLEFTSGIAGLASPGAARPLASLARFLGLVDPPVLLAYALSLPDFRRLARTRWVWVGYGFLALLVLGVGASMGSTSPATGTLETAYVNGTYIAAFVCLAKSYLRESRRFFARQLFFLAVAVGFAGLSRSVAIVELEDRFFPGPAVVPLPMFSLLVALALLAVTGLFLRGTRRAQRSLHPLMGWLVFALAAFFLVLEGAHWIQRETPIRGISNLHYNGRWIIFALLIGYGVLRFQLFDFEYRSREAIVLLASLFIALVSAMGIGAAALARGTSLLEAHLLGLVAGTCCGLVVHLVLRRGLQRSKETDPVRYHERRLEIYEATLEYAVQKPVWSREDVLFVETLREVFEISPDEHQRVLSAVSGPAPRWRTEPAP